MKKGPFMNNKYENWNGSRWEFTKSQSEWHFDPSIENSKDYQEVRIH